METSAAKHGGELLKMGFSIAQVVRDYGDLCQAVTELAVVKGAAVTVDEFRDFNRCLDDAIAGAVTEYTRLREHSITDRETERLGSWRTSCATACRPPPSRFRCCRAARSRSAGAPARCSSAACGACAS
jgi:hypothetical protein